MEDKLTIQKNKHKYGVQKSGAKRRGISWEFDFESWLSWWYATGHWADRGRKKDQYCMCRYGDEGAYSPENTFCETMSYNAKNVRPSVLLTRSLNGKLNVPTESNNVRRGKKNKEIFGDVKAAEMRNRQSLAVKKWWQNRKE